MRRFSFVCLFTVLIGSISESVWAGDERSNYIGFGYGLAPCTIMTTARDERYPQVIIWLAGYLTSYNRWQPDTYDITGGPDAHDWETWIHQYCGANPTKPIAKAAAAFVTTFHPSRLTQDPTGI